MVCVWGVAARSVWAPGEGEASEADIAMQRNDPETSRCRESPLSSGALTRRSEGERRCILACWRGLVFSFSFRRCF